jgi:hypothetical protein
MAALILAYTPLEAWLLIRMWRHWKAIRQEPGA